MGHTIIQLNGTPCTCGSNGCLERYASATAVVNIARDLINTGAEMLRTPVCGVREAAPEDSMKPTCVLLIRAVAVFVLHVAGVRAACLTG